MQYENILKKLKASSNLKAVNWALRNIRKRNLNLNKKAIETAKEIQNIPLGILVAIGGNEDKENDIEVIREGHVLEAIGNGLIVILDEQHIKYSNVSKIDMGAAIAVENVIVHTLVKGYGYDLQSRRYIKPEYIQRGDL